MFLIVGLGNPGAEYDKTRHNMGFMTADALHSVYKFSPFKSKFDGLIAEGNINGEKVYLLKPQTYMNLSGNSVVKAANFYKILRATVSCILRFVTTGKETCLLLRQTRSFYESFIICTNLWKSS